MSNCVFNFNILALVLFGILGGSQAKQLSHLTLTSILAPRCGHFHRVPTFYNGIDRKCIHQYFFTPWWYRSSWNKVEFVAAHTRPVGREKWLMVGCFILSGKFAKNCLLAGLSLDPVGCLSASADPLAGWSGKGEKWKKRRGGLTLLTINLRLRACGRQ